MELSRQDYPALLNTLAAPVASRLLHERLRTIERTNTGIASWLQERRRIEEQYALDLRKLAARQLLEDNSDLGIFSTSWQKILSAVDSLASSHHVLAANIEADVERPIREFANSNREMQAMTTITGNLQSIAKDVESANKKADKLKEKGGKAAAGKVASAANDVESATGEWSSQAPYVFERLQEVDELRLENIKNALTIYATLVSDSASASTSSAEDCLNSLLNVQTIDEIKTFAARNATGTSQSTRPISRAEPPALASTTGSSFYERPNPTLSPPPNDDQRSQRANSVNEKPDKPEKTEKKGGLSGLKRLGTVIGRRRQSTHPYGQPLASEPEPKKSTSNLDASTMNPLRRNRSKDQRFSEIPSGFGQDERRPSEQSMEPPRTAGGSTAPRLERGLSDISSRQTQFGESQQNPQMTNGTSSNISPTLQEPLQPSRAATTNTELPAIDESGFSIPSTDLDPISQAEAEAAALNDNAQNNFRVDIRNAPIAEEDGDASAAMANVANALRAQAAPKRSMGTVRGRRDRNTVLMTNPPEQLMNLPATSAPSTQATPSAVAEAFGAPTETISTSVPSTAAAAAEPFQPQEQSRSMQSMQSSSDILSPSPVPAQPIVAAILPPPTLPTPPLQASPLRTTHQDLAASTASDTHSIRSGRSLSSAGSQSAKHPDLHGPGLSSSIVETVSAWFEDSKVVRTVVVGEVALAYNPIDFSAPFGAETIRLENFSSLEKVAPNPAFIEAITDPADGQARTNPGSYSINTRGIVSKTVVAFKYQVRVQPGDAGAYTPLQIRASWKIEPTQASVVLHYNLNPAYVTTNASVGLQNVVLILNLDPAGAKATTAKAMGGGVFSQDRGVIYWRLGDIRIAQGAPATTLRARFFTDGPAKPGNVEARWETSPSDNDGESLSISMLATKGSEADNEADPFADEETQASSADVDGSWKPVAAVRKLKSGTYLYSSSATE